ncbi:sulfatase [Aureliella helgolandensis]|uniref:Arylsulfatase n=1 Tax=Aureliella helgolandensis TaxID=2527968 RepID=A0A518G295_9BACT|nr:sulfatase [Aureliella helgolandensis]QDV22718.1 Arylsulfatase [Aureliella helgolandensis]
MRNPIPRILKSVLYLSASWVIVACVAYGQTRDEGARNEGDPRGDSVRKQLPDVLFIAVDDLNDWTGHLAGHPQSQTPHIDRLVERGVVFTNAHCVAPACNPSRAGLMSGIRPWETGIYLNSDPAQSVMRETLTLNRHFLAQGYKAFGGGKIYHGTTSEGRGDTWTDWGGRFSTKHGGEPNRNGLSRSHFDWGPLDIPASEMGDYQLTDWAIDKLQHQPVDEPMFLAVGYVKPHLPWYVPQEYFDRFPLDEIQLPLTTESDLDDIPAAGRKMAGADGDHRAVVAAGEWKKGVQGYLATISFLDDQVGRLLEGLEHSPRAENTIVVWWTDHGWALGEKQHWRKFALWNDTTHTSFAIAAPGVTTPGTRCAAAVDYLSVYPTLCQLAGVPTPEHVRGPSLLPLLRDPAAEWEHVAICTHGRGNHAAMDQRYRLIRYADGTEELYDTTQDPNEWHNVAGRAELADVKARLARALPAAEDEIKTRPAKGKGGKRNAASKQE